jgi:hypothetical protein
MVITNIQFWLWKLLIKALEQISKLVQAKSTESEWNGPTQTDYS